MEMVSEEQTATVEPSSTTTAETSERRVATTTAESSTTETVETVQTVQTETKAEDETFRLQVFMPMTEDKREAKALSDADVAEKNPGDEPSDTAATFGNSPREEPVDAESVSPSASNQ